MLQWYLRGVKLYFTYTLPKTPVSKYCKVGTHWPFVLSSGRDVLLSVSMATVANKQTLRVFIAHKGVFLTYMYI